MSAWPEAVWIVKKLQSNFNFTSQLNRYTDQLNALNSRINGLIDKVSLDENNLESTRAILQNKMVTFFAESNNGIPTGSNLPDSFEKGTIWLVTG